MIRMHFLYIAAAVVLLNGSVLYGAENVDKKCVPGPYTTDGNTVLLMHFDEGKGDPGDNSGFENQGVIKGGVTWVNEGRFGGALSFDGTSGYIDAGSDKSLDLNGPMTVEAWVKPVATPGEDKGIMGRKGGIVAGYMLFYGSRNNPYAYLTTTDQGHHYISSGVVFEENAWQHVAFTYDGISTANWYLNGKLVKTDAKTTSGKIVGIQNARFIIGMYGGNRFYKGLIDEVRVSNVVREFSSIETDK